MERTKGFEPALPAWEADVLPLTPHPHGALPRCRPGRPVHTKDWRTPIRRARAGRAGLEPASLIPLQRRTAPACRATGHREPPFGVDPNRPLYRSGAAAVRGGKAPTRCRTRTLHVCRGRLASLRSRWSVRPPGLEPGRPSRSTSSSGWRVYLIPPRAHESRHPGSNRAVRCTKAEPQAVRGGKAAFRGFEPRLPESESGVLPFERKGIECGGAIRTHRPRGLGSRGVSVAVTSAYAAGDSNPELTD